MELYDPLAPGLCVQAINVLSDKGETGSAALQIGQRPVPRIWLCPRDKFAPPLVPLPDQAGVSGKRLGGRELLRVEARPEPGLGFAERRNTALGRDARAGQHGDVLGIFEGLYQVRGRSCAPASSTRDGAEKFFCSLGYRHLALLAGGHVPERADAPLELVFTENGRV